LAARYLIGWRRSIDQAPSKKPAFVATRQSPDLARHRECQRLTVSAPGMKAAGDVPFRYPGGRAREGIAMRAGHDRLDRRRLHEVLFRGRAALVRGLWGL
jgi:hypothetical protein